MSTQGPIALVGSGEYLPVMAAVEQHLLAGRPAVYVQLATAAAPEGEDSLARWHALGRQQAERLGVQQVVVDVRTRHDADDPSLAAQLEGAGLVYLSGGNPTYLADTLRGTRVWAAILAAHYAGAALAGCSAGAMVFMERIPSLRHPVQGDVDGLGLLPHLRVIPHFDQMARFVPDVLSRYVLKGTRSTMLVGIDEETALVGGPEKWTVMGERSVWELTSEGRNEFRPGTTLTTPSDEHDEH